MTEELNVLIGAGFSFSAGLPLGNDVKNKFEQSLRNKILRAGSSEWMWIDDKSDAEIHNGRMAGEHLEYAFIIEEIVNAYKTKNGGVFTDYEDFYQYVKDMTPQPNWYEGIIAIASERFYNETDLKDRNSEYYGHAFRRPERYKPQEIINYLIADMLSINISKEELKERYSPFINYISKYKTVNIFSLNHDRVLEWLLKLNGLSFCDGFSEVNSNLKYQDISLKSFQNEFNSANIRLVKPHGSIDMYLFEHADQANGVLARTGGYTYFKPGGYQEKHYAKRINPASGEILQEFNPDIVPKFITGKNKKAFIQQDYMYSLMYLMYQEKFRSGNDLLIIGYSFRDEHMNDELQKFSTSEGPEIINLNKGNTFPFEAPKVVEIQNFNELPL